MARELTIKTREAIHTIPTDLTDQQVTELEEFLKTAGVLSDGHKLYVTDNDPNERWPQEWPRLG